MDKKQTEAAAAAEETIKETTIAEKADESAETSGEQGGEAEQQEDAVEAEAFEDDEPVAAVIHPEVQKALEETYPTLREHGSHNAAMKGLQTDASGSYTPPGQL